MARLTSSSQGGTAQPTRALFERLLNREGVPQIAANLGLHSNTVKRWLLMDKVPGEYFSDFARMLDMKIEGQQGIDQFYTKPEVAKWCWQQFRVVAKDLGVNLRKYHFVEPSAGCGWFYNQMPRSRRTGIDIAPKPIDVLGGELVEADFLKWRPKRNTKYVVLGNPPFGLRGHLALQFINHSAKFADLVGFILPQLFESDGKGVPAKRVRGLELAYSAGLPPDSFLSPDGKPITVHTIFQVWTKVNLDRIRLPKKKSCKEYIKIYSLSDGGTPASTRNKKMLYKCDVYLPSTCFDNMQAYGDFESLPHRRGYGVVILKQKRKIKALLKSVKWNEVAYSSTNGAVNLRSSLISDQVVKGGFIDVA